MVLRLAFELSHLLFASWPVPAEVVAEHLPDPLAVGEYDGTGWLSVVAFVNEHVRPRGLPARVGVRVPQVDLRTYVTADGDPGVYFLSLDADSRAAVAGGRLLHHLPYYDAAVSHRLDGYRVTFESRRRHPGARPARFAATYRPAGDPFVAEPGSLAAFLTARRRLFARGRRGGLRHTDLQHDRFRLQDAEVQVTENTLFRAAGIADPGAETGVEPVYHYSPGVAATTSRSGPWEPTE